MSPHASRALSLRRLLFRWLVLPLSAMFIMTALLVYPFAVSTVRHGYDEALLDTAHSLSRMIPSLGAHSPSPTQSAVRTVLRSDQYDRIYYSVHSADGALLAGDAELTAPPFDELAKGEVLYDGRIAGESVRVAALMLPQERGAVYVQAAETTVKRQRLTQHMLLGALAIEIVLLATIAVLVWIGIDKGLAPLQRLSREIELRSPRDLHAIPEEQVPIEARSMVSALNDLLQRLAGLLRKQQDFVSNTAHQLRTPLAGLQVEIEYALQRRAPEDWRRALETLAPLSSRTAHLVNQLLTLAKTEGGAAVTPQMATIELRREIADVAAQWMPQAIAKDIDVGLELEDLTVSGNAFLLRELISNLVDNAITYSATGGRITVRACRRDAGVVIEVEDEGIGIPPEERQNVFERFYRVAGAPGGGSGLGLAIVREIAEIHGASVEIRAPASGRGTIAAVRFTGVESGAAA